MIVVLVPQLHIRFFFYKFGISLKGNYLSIRWCKDNADIYILYDNFTRKNYGIVENTVFTIRDARGDPGGDVGST